jgi:hypothetical protein
MVSNNFGRQRLHYATTVAAVSPQPRRPATLLPSAIAMTATATITLFPSSADGRHMTSAVIFAAILLLFNS